ncbi:MAG: hypothetical protein OIF48_10030 [Silicimonas sp.]|nr:hypothetical protein [Silicimonas sp.]
MKKCAIAAGLFALSACASATEAVNSDVSRGGLQASTAAYFATSRTNVRIGNLNQSVLGTAYQSRVGGQLYDCNYFRGAVSCNRAR